MLRRCSLCNVTLNNENTFNDHYKGKKHRQQLKLVESDENTIVVEPPQFFNQQSVVDFFSRYDEILKYHCDKNHILIVFKTKKTAQRLLTTAVIMNGFKINIHSKNNDSFKVDNVNHNPPPVNKDTNVLLYDNIKSIFDVKSTFDQQLKEFLNTVTLTESENAMYYERTCELLTVIFQRVFPNCKIHRFGSTISGLAFKNSDLDIFLETAAEETISDLKPNALVPNTFSKVKKLLYAYPNLFTKVCPIPRAKTPIIKFRYLPEQISCDISFKNSLAIHSSKLVKFYFSLYPQLQPTMMIIKYLVCNYEIQEQSKLSKYALAILFIFYLQQPPIKLLPLVKDLKINCDPEIIEDWQVNFDSTIVNQQNQNNCLSVPKLLHGFFKFYANFDFKSNAISIVDGLSHSKLLFNDLPRIPRRLKRYKQYLTSTPNPRIFTTRQPMCVMDPNKLNYNITSGVSATYIDNFQKYCAAARDVCADAAENNNEELLPSLFSTTLVVKNIRTVEFSICYDLFYAADYKNLNFYLDTLVQAFNKKDCNSVVLDLIQIYFEKVLELEVQIINQQDKTIMGCTIHHNLLKNRARKWNIINDDDHSTWTLLEKEIMRTRSMIPDYSSKSEKFKIKFDCHIMKESDNSLRLNLILGKNFGRKTFFEIGNHIKKRMPNILKITLRNAKQLKYGMKLM